MGRARVFLATSLDGFIAGPDDDLSWLPTDGEPGPGAVDFAGFMSECGSMLMGRRTYDVVMGSGGPWPYGDLPVLVATTRELVDGPPTVRAVSGSVASLLTEAKAVAGAKDVYVDGGDLVRRCLADDLIDELILSVVPTLLGGGAALFGALEVPSAWEFAAPTIYGRMVQLRATRVRDQS